MYNCICFDFSIKGELSFIDKIYQIAIFILCIVLYNVYRYNCLFYFDRYNFSYSEALLLLYNVLR